jgi:hypothetical protein
MLAASDVNGIIVLEGNSRNPPVREKVIALIGGRLHEGKVLSRAEMHESGHDHNHQCDQANEP